MLVGYMRVSKTDGSQTLDPQRDALLAAGIEPDRLYEDRASGRSDQRPGLAACLKALRVGDTLVVWKLDRLGRNLHHLVNTVHDLTPRGVGLKVLTGQGAAIDITTAAGKLVFGIFAAVRAGAHLRADRDGPGLRPGPWPQRRLAVQDDAGQAPPRRRVDGQARDPGRRVVPGTRELGITRQTLYRHVSPRGELRPDGIRLLAEGKTIPRGSAPAAVAPSG